MFLFETENRRILEIKSQGITTKLQSTEIGHRDFISQYYKIQYIFIM